MKFKRTFAAFLLLFVKGLVILAVATSATFMSPSTHSARQRLILDRSRRNRSVLEAVESDSLIHRSVLEAALSGFDREAAASFLLYALLLGSLSESPSWLWLGGMEHWHVKTIVQVRREIRKIIVKKWNLKILVSVFLFGP